MIFSGSKAYAKKIAHSKQVLHNAEHLEGLIEAFQEYNSTCPSQREGLAAAKRGCKVKTTQHLLVNGVGANDRYSRGGGYILSTTMCY